MTHFPLWGHNLQKVQNSLKRELIIFGKPHIEFRLAGYGINRAEKSSLTAPFGKATACQMGWIRGKEPIKRCVDEGILMQKPGFPGQSFKRAVAFSL